MASKKADKSARSDAASSRASEIASGVSGRSTKKSEYKSEAESGKSTKKSEYSKAESGKSTKSSKAGDKSSKGESSRKSSKADSSKAESSKAESSKAESSRGASEASEASEASGASEASASEVSGATSSAKSDMSQSAVTSSAMSKSYSNNDNDSTVADMTYSQGISYMSQRDMSYASGPLDKNMEQQAIDAATKAKNTTAAAVAGARTGRKILIMRHAERMDRIFQVWLKLSFTDSGSYRPYDLNMPLSLPKRKDGANAYHNDCPITEMGNVTSQMIGRGLRLHKTNIVQVFCSPAFRCIQTANTLFKGFKVENLNINIEPGLFEWLGWYESTPTWMPPDELEGNGLKVNLNYNPVMTEDQLCNCAKESEKDYYERTEKVMKELVSRYPEQGTLLIVSHGATIDAGARPLLGRKMDIPNRNQFDRMGLVYPYTCVVGLEELKGNSGNVWKLINTPIPPITYLDFSNRMDAEFFNRE